MTDSISLSDNDTLYRYLFKERAARGEWVRLNQTFIDTLNTHHYPRAVQNLLGELLVATSLLTATMKFEGEITLQIQSQANLKLALVNGNHQQEFRALARHQGEIAETASLREMVGEKAILVISILPKNGERYQGIIALDKPTLTACIEDYFMQSEQLPTRLLIRVGEYKNQAVAAGMLVQLVPDGTGDAEDFNTLDALMQTSKDEELFGLPAEELLYRLFHEQGEIALYPAQRVKFNCGCSRERSGAALLLLPVEEREEMLAEKQGVIDMQCECCGTQYFFNHEALQALEHEQREAMA